MTDPHPDLTAICDVLNEASDTTPGTNLLPYAERIKAIAIEALAQEAESHAADHVTHWEGDDRTDFLLCDGDTGEFSIGNSVSDWLRAHVPEGTA